MQRKRLILEDLCEKQKFLDRTIIRAQTQTNTYD